LPNLDELKQHIQRLREDFMQGSLGKSDVDPQPSLQFRQWMQQAVEVRVPEVQAMTLCTCGSDGRPSGRVVYLREFGEDEYCFYTNYNSRKSREIQENSFASATFFWPQLERQIRIEGTVGKAEEKRSDEYFNLRPYESKLGAWASAQSDAIGSRKELEDRIRELREQMPEHKIVRPPFWGGLVLKAERYEFWQGRKNRLHDRIAYERSAENWKILRLAP
jgi:pyridoxamine 5'-phosphate oxidase